MAENECPICMCDFEDQSLVILPCVHKFHRECLRKLYRATKNVIFEGERLEPKCPLCRATIHSKDIGGHVTTVKERIEFQNLQQLQRMMNEPSYAALPMEERPLRLARVLIEINKQERERLLDELTRKRNQLLNRSVISEPTAGSSGTQTGFTRTVSQASSTSDDSIRPISRNFRPILEDESSCSPSPGRLFVASQTESTTSDYGRCSEITRTLSSQSARILQDENVHPASPTRMPAFLGSFEQPIEISSAESSQARCSQARCSQEPKIKVEPKVEPGIEQPKLPIFHVKLRPQLKREIKEEQEELQNLQVQLHVISEQLRQADEARRSRSRSREPEDEDSMQPIVILDDESDIEDDDYIGEFEPVEILGTFGRGRHTRYRIHWSDDTIGLHMKDEVEDIAPQLYKNYRRKLAREATARTRLNQATGKTPRIPGRGRGRGRKG